MITLAVLTPISIQNSLFFPRLLLIRILTTSNTHQRTLVLTVTLIPILTITTNQNAMLSLITALIALLMTCSFPSLPRALLPTRISCLPRKGTGTCASISTTLAAHIRCFGLLLFSPCLFRLPRLRCSSRRRRSRIIRAPLPNCPRGFQHNMLPPESPARLLC